MAASLGCFSALARHSHGIRTAFTRHSDGIRTAFARHPHGIRTAFARHITFIGSRLLPLRCSSPHLPRRNGRSPLDPPRHCVARQACEIILNRRCIAPPYPPLSPAPRSAHSQALAFPHVLLMLKMCTGQPPGNYDFLHWTYRRGSLKYARNSSENGKLTRRTRYP